MLDRAYAKKSWHGTNLRGSIRGLSPEQAAWRPSPSRHNIWEIVVHAAYWKYAVLRRLTGEKRGSFPYRGSNWFKRPEQESAAAWKADVTLLERMHRELRQAVGRLSVRDLETTPRGRSTSNEFLITGAAAHDLYHAGQIQLLKKLMKE